MTDEWKSGYDPPRPAAELATAIKDLEHVCDKHTRGIIDRLNRTFVTPLDREDIHALDMREEATDRCEDMADPPVCLIGSRAVLTVPTACVTMSHMKEISLRELHRNTGAWVRSTRRYGAILVRDRNTAVATLTAVTEEPLVNVFERWKPLKKFAALLDRPLGGTRAEDIISEDRDR